MARKTINVKPVTELELQFEDGKSLTLRFDVQALLNFNDLEGGLTGAIKEKSIPIMCSKVVYIGAKAVDENFTYEEAVKITSELDPSTIVDIINEFNESMGTTKNEVQSEAQKKLMKEFIESLSK
jgi:hypothetical protein